MTDDLIVCTGDNCPLKEDCYRFTAEIYGRRDFFTTPPYEQASFSCQYFKTNYVQIQQTAYLIWLEENCPDGQSENHWIKAKKQIIDKKK